MGNVIISGANLPQGTCPTWIIDLWSNVMVPALSGNLVGSLNTFNYGNSTPAPADRDKPWFRLDSSGRPDKWYSFVGGSWISKHAVVPGLIQLWEGDITTIDTFDGGDTNPPSLVTGPMWERVDGLMGRFPLGVGTQITSGTPINVADQGGEETHKLVADEITKHSHEVFAASREADGSGSAIRLAPSIDIGVSYGPTGEFGNDVPHNNMPPWYGLHFIRRTARQFYRL